MSDCVHVIKFEPPKDRAKICTDGMRSYWKDVFVCVCCGEKFSKLAYEGELKDLPWPVED